MLTLQEKRKAVLEEQKRQEKEWQEKKHQKLCKSVKEILQNPRFLPRLEQELIKHGSILLKTGACLCGEKSCHSGKRLLELLKKDNALTPFIDLGIQIDVNWRGLVFSIDDEEAIPYPQYMLIEKANKTFRVEYRP